MKDDPKHLKSILRNRFLGVRDNLSRESVLAKSRRITDHLMNLPGYRTATVIHTYVSMVERNEVHTHNFVEKSLGLNKTVLVPKMKTKGELTSAAISSLDELAANSWGVPEPQQENDADFSEIDLIIVPMVAGDRQKNRLGYGMGYYDRFLSKTNACKAGLLFDCQIYDGVLPTEEFDVPLDMLITESGIIK